LPVIPLKELTTLNDGFKPATFPYKLQTEFLTFLTGMGKVNLTTLTAEVNACAAEMQKHGYPKKILSDDEDGDEDAEI